MEEPAQKRTVLRLKLSVTFFLLLVHTILGRFFTNPDPDFLDSDILPIRMRTQEKKIPIRIRTEGSGSETLAIAYPRSKYYF